LALAKPCWHSKEGMKNYLYIVPPTFRYATKTASMRYAFVLALFFVLGCNKDNNKTDSNELPKCRLSAFFYLGDKYELVYKGDRIVQAGTDRYQLTYTTDGKLVTIERTNPAERTELTYNSDGRVFLERRFEQRGNGNWVEFSIFTYTYTNGKVTGIAENFPSMGLLSDKEVVWEGANIRSIIIRSNNSILCTQQYSYDLSSKNPVAAIIGLYYSDNSAGTYKLALYNSANRLIKEESTCPTAPTINFGYGINSKGLLQSISFDGQPFFTYAYSNCP
jgi:hypothetical protein